MRQPTRTTLQHTSHRKPHVADTVPTACPNTCVHTAHQAVGHAPLVSAWELAFGDALPPSTSVRSTAVILNPWGGMRRVAPPSVAVMVSGCGHGVLASATDTTLRKRLAGMYINMMMVIGVWTHRLCHSNCSS